MASQNSYAPTTGKGSVVRAGKSLDVEFPQPLFHARRALSEFEGDGPLGNAPGTEQPHASPRPIVGGWPNAHTLVQLPPFLLSQYKPETDIAVEHRSPKRRVAGIRPRCHVLIGKRRVDGSPQSYSGSFPCSTLYVHNR